MRKLLSYGALVAENVLLQKVCKKLKSISHWLLQELSIQMKIIGQLKLLQESRSAAFVKLNHSSSFAIKAISDAKLHRGDLT